MIVGQWGVHMHAIKGSRSHSGWARETSASRQRERAQGRELRGLVGAEIR